MCRVSVVMDSKVCSLCKVTFNLDQFHRRKRAKDGLRSDCKSCNSGTAKRWVESNKDHYIYVAKKYREANKLAISIAYKKYYVTNKDYRLGTKKKWRDSNKEHIKKYVQANPHIFRRHSAKRRSQKLNARPSWISQLQHEQIKSLYKQAVDLELATGIKYHVDHRIPLTHPLVCGFDLPINLQLLTQSENCSKSNSFISFVESEIDRSNLLPWQY